MHEVRQLQAGDGIELQESGVLQTLRVQAKRDVLAYLADLASTTNPEKGAALAGINQALNYPSDTVGFNLGKRKAVFATGLAATDLARIQDGINRLPVYGVLDFFGDFVINGAAVLKPRIMLRNAGATITQTNAAADTFVLADDRIAGVGNGSLAPAGMLWTGVVPLGGTPLRVLDAWPGEIKIVGLQMRGPLAQSYAAATALINNEPLRTYTYAAHPAAIKLACNGQNSAAYQNNIAFFDTAFSLVSSIAFRAIENFITYCKFGTWATGNMASAEFNNFVNTCFIGWALNYGTGEASCFNVKVDGIYEGCYVGLWAESAQALQSRSLYFEENRFRDIQAGYSVFSGDIHQIKCWTIGTMMTKSPVNNTAALYEIDNATGNPTATLVTTATDYLHPGWTGNKAKGTNIACIGGNGLHIGRLLFRGQAPQGARWAIYVDADTSDVDIGVSHQLPLPPRFLFENPNTVVLRTNGGLRFGPSVGDYYSNPIAFGDPSSANWASGNSQAGHSNSESAKAYVNLRYTDATGRTSLNIAGSDAASGSEVPVAVLGDFRVTNPAGTVPFLQVNTSPTAWGAMVGNLYSLPNLKQTVQGTHIHDKRDPNNYATLLGASFFIKRLANYANDAAAAAGGIEVDQLYRNGSVLMVRVQ